MNLQSLWQNSQITLYSNAMWVLSYCNLENNVLCTMYQRGTHSKRSIAPLDVSVVPYKKKKTAEELPLVGSWLTLRLSLKQGEAVVHFREETCFFGAPQVTVAAEAVWSPMLRSRLSLRRSTLWIPTRPRPHSWPLTLRPWCPTLRRVPRQTSPLDGDTDCALPPPPYTHLLSLWHILICLPHVVFLFPLVCSSSWMKAHCSPNPPTLLFLPCWTTTTEWQGRQRTLHLSSWQSRTPFSGRPCPTLSWAESCLLSFTPRVVLFDVY